MISPDQIKKKAQRRYEDFLRGAIARDPIFPIDLSVGRVPKNYPDLHKSVTELINGSKETIGFGYTLVLETKNTRKHGPQSLPTKVSIENEKDYLALLQKEASFSQFQSDIALIQATVPSLGSWIYRFPLKVIEYSKAWPGLLRVCQYFQQNPKPNLYLRELPITVHTKFIEEHQDVLRSLLEAILPDDQLTVVEGTSHTFEKRFSIKYREPLLRLRILAPALQGKYGFPFADFSLAVSNFIQLQLGHPQCFITENMMPFLTLPPLENSVAIFGSGRAVGLLKSADWLEDCPIFYWGDMDVDGFKMLSQVRSHFPQTQSLMMDAKTYESFKPFAVYSETKNAKELACLTPQEHDLYRQLADNHQRLEQERISQAYVNQQLLGGF